MPDAPRRKRLIEVAFPLEEVSEHSRREKNVRHGHISTLHIWWARRPLAACRAFIYASLVDDPEDDREREELLKEIADLASWDAVRKPELVVRPKDKGGSGLTGHELLERARRRILECNGGKPPRLLDPFAGGGAIPLEALRLGCEVEASDLNPVAVLILKGTVEYPQKYGRPLALQRTDTRWSAQPDIHASKTANRRYTTATDASSGPTFGDGKEGNRLPIGQSSVERESRMGADIAGVNGEVPQYIIDAAKAKQKSFFDGDLVEAYRNNPLVTDVRYWGNWMLERAREELAEFYPPDPDGSIPVAYLWSRTVPCPNCGAEMPLIRQYWLARTDKNRAALRPVIDRDNNRVDFDVVEGLNVSGDPGEATTSRGDTLCLLCRQVVKAAYVHEAGRRGEMGARMTAVVLEAQGRGGKRFRRARETDLRVFHEAELQREALTRETLGDFPAIPDEPLAYHPQYMLVREYGLDLWGKLFNDRQLLALITFARLVGKAHAEMLTTGLGAEYARGLATYLGLLVDKIAIRGSTCGVWHAGRLTVENSMGDGTLPMAWDYPEATPLGASSGSASTSLGFLVAAVEEVSKVDGWARVVRRDARAIDTPSDIVLTDPPYYDAINYADLSDFFFVWLKRSLGEIDPIVTSMPLTPKREQIVMNVYATAKDDSQDRKAAARQLYIEGMAESFKSMSLSLSEAGLAEVVFAHTDPDAWGTLIEGMLHADLNPDASWPIDTEQQTGSTKAGKAKLKTSTWMVCRRREAATQAFLDDVLREMRPVIRERLLYFWSKQVRGADFFISAIGPALSVFGRHTKVMYPDGKDVSVRDFLDLVRREATHVALEQVLGGAVLGQLDSITQQYVTWVWSYSRAPLDAGEAIALCLATGADYGEVVRPGSIAAEVKEKSKKLVKLRTIRERGAKEDELGISNGARPVPLIDQLQRAAYLWSLTRTDQLAAYRASLGETRWTALRTLGQAVAECLPEGDEDRRLIHGLLGSNVMATTPRDTGPGANWREQPGKVKLPGFEGRDAAE